MSTIAAMTMKVLRARIVPPSTFSPRMFIELDGQEIDASGRSAASGAGEGPNSDWMMFSRMNDTPIAVMSGARRGAWRRGR